MGSMIVLPWLSWKALGTQLGRMNTDEYWLSFLVLSRGRRLLVRDWRPLCSRGKLCAFLGFWEDSPPPLCILPTKSPVRIRTSLTFWLMSLQVSLEDVLFLSISGAQGGVLRFVSRNNSACVAPGNSVLSGLTNHQEGAGGEPTCSFHSPHNQQGVRVPP